MIRRVETLSTEAFAPFGEILAKPDTPGHSINQGSGESWLLARLRLTEQEGVAALSLYRVAAAPADFRIGVMERHPASTQAFIPLGAGTLLAIVAPAAERLDPAAIRVFAVPPGSGVNFATGTWHHPAVALGVPAEALVVGRVGPGDCDIVTLDRPITVDFGH
ncbi:MAG TPA: ureidoglycolate lyase [Stellaceae bacterium]|nr:ureidoglycolate lyase [Stellaceae bacterium]